MDNKIVATTAKKAVDIKTFNTSEITLLAHAYTAFKEKQECNYNMNEIAKGAHMLDKKTLLKLKDYKHYRGRGWIDKNNPIDKAEETVPFPDRVSPCLRRLREIVYNCKRANCLDVLDVYLKSMEKFGIKITIDKNNDYGKPEKEVDRKKLDSIINDMDKMQSEICELANNIRDTFSLNAEKIKLCPKTNFKDFLRVYTENVEKQKKTIFASEKLKNSCEMILNGLPKVIDAANKNS